MDITLYSNTSPNNKINKALSAARQLSCTLKGGSDVLRPQIEIIGAGISSYNYMYIPFFGRYYFIEDIENLRENLWRVTGRVDVLQTYASQILNNRAVIRNSTTEGANNYLTGSGQWVRNVKDKTDIITFSNGLLDTGEYILITAGG